MISLSHFRNKHFLALSGNMVISVLSVVMMSLLYRALTKADVGTWFFFLSFTGLAEAIRNGFLSTATVKYFAGTDYEKGESVLGSIWTLAILLTLLFLIANGIAWLFLSHFSNPQMLLVVKWFGITLLSSLPFTITFWILVAKEDYEKILWLRLVNNGSMVIIIVTLLFLHKMTLENQLILNFVTNVLTSLVCIAFKLTHITSIFKRKTETILSIAHFGKYSLATNLSSNLLGSSDTFIITFLLGPAALAVYNLPKRLMEIIEIPLRSFIGTGMSSMAKAMNNHRKDEVLHIFKKYAGMLTFAFIPIVVGGILLADVAIDILGGDKYLGTEAANIFRMFLLFSFLFPIDRFNGVTLDILHLPRVNLHKVMAMLVVNIIADFLGVYIFKNMYGMAIASPFVMLTGLLIGHFALVKVLPYTIKEVLVTGWNETKWFIDSNLAKFRSKKTNS
jgi:O-antigen/teichoic acid export membrane protein